MKRLLSLIDAGFAKISERMLSTLRTQGLNPEEEYIINDSLHNKYIPVLRNAVFISFLATPGTLLTKPEEIQYILAIVASITGIAWFTVSLKEVKGKFMQFGLELTRDMLQAFLSTVFLICCTVGLQLVLSLLSEAGLVHHEYVQLIAAFFQQTSVRAFFGLMTLFLGLNIILNLVRSVFKFDATDAMLTGSSEAARAFYARSLSELRKAADILNSPHGVEAANFQIARALDEYLITLSAAAKPVDGARKRQIEELFKQLRKPQEAFDRQVIPLLKEIFSDYKPYIDPSSGAFRRHQRTLTSLEELERAYEKKEALPQDFVDALLSNALMTLVEFLELYKDRLLSTIDAHGAARAGQR